MLTLEAFRRAAMERPKAGLAWLGRLKRISSSDVQSIFDQIPCSRITDYGIKFATKLLEINHHRLADLAKGLQQ